MTRCHDVKLIEQIHPSLYEMLVESGFIVSDSLDEVQDCADKIISKLQSDNYVRVTINPTLDCNLRCWYCYEAHLAGSCMSQDTLHSVMLYLEHTISSPTLKTFQLAFFGGEPLLYYKKIVHPLVEKCSELRKKYKKELQVNFTTNGVCLTPHIVDDLSKLCNWVSVQVAFDGGKTLHDKVKYYKNGKGTYNVLLHNLLYAVKKGLLTTVRCNYTKDNILSFYEVVTDFEEYHKYENLRFSFHKVWQEEDSKELIDNMNLLKSKLAPFKFQSNIKTYLGSNIQHCYADYAHNIVINYNGDIYKCTAREFNADNKIGRLSVDGIPTYISNIESWKQLYVAECCQKCRLFPICTECIQRRKETGENKCSNDDLRRNAETNIQKYFYDMMKFNGITAKL